MAATGMIVTEGVAISVVIEMIVVVTSDVTGMIVTEGGVIEAGSAVAIGTRTGDFAMTVHLRTGMAEEGTDPEIVKRADVIAYVGF